MNAGRALVAGAGIAGLTLALALARRGIACRLIERAPALDEIGAGVQLSPNAGRILDALGLGPALDAAATRPDGVTIADGLSGRTLKRLPLGVEGERRWGAPYRVIHRGDLQTVLLESVRAEPLVELTLGAGIADVRETAEGVSVDLTTGETATGAWLAGADGLNSVVRRAVKLPTTPRGSGLKAWRKVVAAAALPAAFEAGGVTVWLGPGAHVVVYPVRAGREANLVVIGDERAASPSELVKGWAAPALALIDGSASWTPWPLCDRAPDARMSRGRIALLGDAAHPALPSLAQGAAFAIEDAAVLARLVAQAEPDALAAYDRARLMRVVKLQQRSRRQMTIDHLSSLAAQGRNIALAAAPTGALIAGLDWMYGWRDDG